MILALQQLPKLVLVFLSIFDKFLHMIRHISYRIKIEIMNPYYKLSSTLGQTVKNGKPTLIGENLASFDSVDGMFPAKETHLAKAQLANGCDIFFHLLVA